MDIIGWKSFQKIVFLIFIYLVYAFNHKDFISRSVNTIRKGSTHTPSGKERVTFFNALFQSSLLAPVEMIHDTGALFKEQSK